MAHTKAEWRATLLAARRALPAEVRAPREAAIADRVIATPWFRASRALLTYVPIGAEVDPAGVAMAARARGIPVLAPADARPPACWVALDAAARTDGPPVEAPAGPLLVVVPGVGFDLRGGRLGRGRGFYDRALGTLRAAADVAAVVGVAFECQVVAALPRDAWDEDVDLVATEERLLVAPRADPARSGART